MTIEERANLYALETIESNKDPKYNKEFSEFIAKTEKTAYIKGATEQRYEDIQRAVEFLKNEVDIKEHYRYTKEWYVEQLEKAMKGE